MAQGAGEGGPGHSSSMACDQKPLMESTQLFLRASDVPRMRCTSGDDRRSNNIHSPVRAARDIVISVINLLLVFADRQKCHRASVRLRGSQRDTCKRANCAHCPPRVQGHPSVVRLRYRSSAVYLYCVPSIRT